MPPLLPRSALVGLTRPCTTFILTSAPKTTSSSITATATNPVSTIVTSLPLRSFTTTPKNQRKDIPHPERTPHPPLRRAGKHCPPYPYGGRQTFKQADKGLYGLSSVRYGNVVAEKYGNKARRRWMPNVHRRRFFSRILGHHVRVRLTASIMRTIIQIERAQESAKRRREREVLGATTKKRSRQLDFKTRAHADLGVIRSDRRCVSGSVGTNSGGVGSIVGTCAIDAYLLGTKTRRLRELGLHGWKLRWLLLRRLKQDEKLRPQNRVNADGKTWLEQMRADIGCTWKTSQDFFDRVAKLKAQIQTKKEEENKAAGLIPGRYMELFQGGMNIQDEVALEAEVGKMLKDGYEFEFGEPEELKAGVSVNK